MGGCRYRQVIFCDLLLSFYCKTKARIWQMTKHNSRQKTEDGRMLVKRGDDKFWVVTVTNDHHCTKGSLFYVLINSATFSSCFFFLWKKKNKMIIIHYWLVGILLVHLSSLGANPSKIIIRPFLCPSYIYIMSWQEFIHKQAIIRLVLFFCCVIVWRESCWRQLWKKNNSVMLNTWHAFPISKFKDRHK